MYSNDNIISRKNNEAEKFFPTLKVCTYDGSVEKRKKQLEEFGDFDLIITSFDVASRDCDELQKVKAIANDLPFDLKFATSNFMGYGLYKQNIYGLDDFIKLFSKQIYSKSKQIYSKAPEANKC